jgi:hypothetical protein
MESWYYPRTAITKPVQFSVNTIMVMPKGSKQLYNFKLYTFLRIFNFTSDNLIISSQHSGSFPGNETWPICFIALRLCPTIQAMPHNNNKIPLLRRRRYPLIKLFYYIYQRANLRDTERGISQWLCMKWKNIKNGKIVKAT